MYTNPSLLEYVVVETAQTRARELVQAQRVQAARHPEAPSASESRVVGWAWLVARLAR